MSLLSRRPTAVIACGLLLFALLVAGLAYLSTPVGPTVYPTDTSYVVRDCGRLDHFDSEAEIQQYLAAEQQMWQNYRGGLMWGDVALGGGPPAPGAAGTEYSGTNVQVEGVDEVDIVKTDGTYIYTISGDEVVIVRAYPPALAGVVARIPTSATGLFIDETRLTVLYDDYGSYYGGGFREGGYRTGVKVYDVANPAAPALVRNVSVDGMRIGARMTDRIVYMVATSYVYAYDERVYLPTLRDGGQERVLAPTEIGFFKDAPYGGGLTMVLAVDPFGIGSTLTTFLTGYVNDLYVSMNAIYVAGFVYRVPADGRSWEERTAVHRIAFDGLTTQYACTAEVPGSILDQWSLDEYQGYLRVATTVNGWTGEDSGSGVYVFDGALNFLGSVENLAPGETLHSVRFVGDRAYVVTFMKIDPLFVIDLSNPADPQLLGQLHIPGFSDYLHPFGPDHLIGVGKDTRLGEGGSFSWFQGVKLSLFDVSDPLDPRESAKVVVGDRGTESEVLQDHKAFLFHAQRSLIALPIDLAIIDPNDWPDPTPDWAYGDLVWQGLIIYSVSVDGGFTELGRITHGAVQGETSDYSLFVRRSLYIEDVFYSVSDSLVRMNDLATLSPIGDVPL